MNKVCFIITAAFISMTNIALAERCDSSLGNKSFYRLDIYKKEVTCTYRYCYYTCDYAYDYIQGRFKPEYGSWEKNEDGHHYCYDSSCTMTRIG